MSILSNASLTLQYTRTDEVTGDQSIGGQYTITRIEPAPCDPYAFRVFATDSQDRPVSAYGVSKGNVTHCFGQNRGNDDDHDFAHYLEAALNA